MPILSEDDPRIGCLAVPASAVAGFVLLALTAAAVGASAGVSSILGLVGMVGGALTAAFAVRRSS